tara:strand:+ start:265 stop:558 length:294 start_codon:yes stop_codon:yes gene_type:complete
MKIKPTFTTTRNKEIYSNLNDINNYLLTIICLENKEYNFILRDLLNNFSLMSKIINRYKVNFKYYDVSRISKIEYDMLKNINTPTINSVNLKQISGK